MMMKTKIIVTIMVFSGLWLTPPYLGHAQERLFIAYTSDLCSDMPVLSCFVPTSYAGVRFRNDFGTKELMHAEFSGNYRIQRNCLLASVTHYGYADYGNAQLAVGYGRDFGERFAFSGRIQYIMEHARGYPTRHSLCTDFGFAFKFSKKVMLFSAVHNPFMMRYGIVGQDVIPLKFTIGCVYAPVQKLLLSAITAKDLPGGWEIGCRFTTQPATPLLITVDGTNTHLGLTIHWIHKTFLFSVKTAWYYRISVSPEIGGYYYPDNNP
jgi:hypothetical protein